MNHPLDGARLKVVRAQEHIDSLKAEVRMYLDEEPYEIAAEHDGKSWQFVTTISVNPPLRFSTIIGDCVTNARAALDYISWELAARYVPNITRDPIRSKKFAFPIREPVDPPGDGYVNKINRLTNLISRGYPAPAIDEIQAVQPNHAGYKPLWWLNELVNFDKHRMPLLTIGHIAGADMEILVRPAVNHMGWAKRVTGVARLTTDGSIPRSDMEVDCQATVYVAWQDVAMPPEPVDRTLEQIIKTVANVIPRFDPFFV